MNKLITVIIDGGEFAERISKDFKGDELTSPEQQAILFLKEIDKEKEEF